MNDGDWVESCTALVEHHSGKWEIITWTKEKDDVVTNFDSSSHERSNRSTGESRTTVRKPKHLRASPKNNDLATEV